jgi:hypothetical protein
MTIQLDEEAAVDFARVPVEALMRRVILAEGDKRRKVERRGLQDRTVDLGECPIVIPRDRLPE